LKHTSDILLDSGGNEFGAAALGLPNGLSRRFWYAHYRQVADPFTNRAPAFCDGASNAFGDSEAAATASDKLIDYIQEFTRKLIG
jgi:hypothetical protein